MHIRLFYGLLALSICSALPQQQGTRGPSHVCASGRRTPCTTGPCSNNDLLCLPVSGACGLVSCPVFAFCDQFSQQCHPNTCEHRLHFWCPYDHGHLREVPCMYSLPDTQCHASSTGRFTCSVSGGILTASCDGRVEAGVAAAQLPRSRQQPTQHAGQKKTIAWLYQHIQDLSGRVIGHEHGRSSIRRIDNSSTGSWSSLHWLTAILQRVFRALYNQQGLPEAKAGAGGVYSSSSSSSSRSLQQVGNAAIYTGNLDSSNYARFFPGNSPDGIDPNMPFGQGSTGQFVDGLLDSVLNNQNTANLVSKFIGPSYGGPIPVSAVQPTMNPSGNLIQTGGNPGGTFIRAGPGGAVAGTYGGGWQGPYNTRSGTYGLGGNYGFAGPYLGEAQGTAIFAVSNATYFPGASTITYACPAGAANGTMIAMGIPCGVQMISLPARKLPTTNGLPAGPLLPGSVSAPVSCVFIASMECSLHCICCSHSVQHIVSHFLPVYLCTCANVFQSQALLRQHATRAAPVRPYSMRLEGWTS